MEGIKRMSDKEIRTDEEQESSSAFFRRSTPKFLDWTPPTEKEKALAVEARREAREAELKRVTELAKVREAEKAAQRKRGPSEVIKKRRRGAAV